MTGKQRYIACGVVIAVGLAAQAGIEAACRLERPPLVGKLNDLPMMMGDWSGSECPVSADVIRESNTTEYLSRTYESPRFPGVQLRLWINYSVRGLNLFHSPEICMPAGGWTRIESQTKVVQIPAPRGSPISVSKLAYMQRELVGNLAFWYYIFGEGPLEDYVRSLSITSRSSYGRVTRGSSATFEVFYSGERDRDGAGLRDFLEQVIRHADPILPANRAAYYVP